MLNPENWNIEPPQYSLRISEHSVSQTNETPVFIKNHYFNHSVCVVLPETDNIPEIKNSIIDDKDYYKIHSLYPHELLNEEFIKAFIKRGELSLLTIDRKIDIHDSLAITPSGHLLLSVTGFTYQSLGLEGKLTFFDRKFHSRYDELLIEEDFQKKIPLKWCAHFCNWYNGFHARSFTIVTLDLKKDHSTPGKENHERIKQCLRDHFHKPFDFIVAWDPPEDKICPSSIALWFTKQGYEVSLCHQKFTHRSAYLLDVPVLDQCDSEKFFEWLGVITICGNGMKSEEIDESEYQLSSFITKKQHVHCLESRGFFTRKMIENIHHVMRECMKSKDISYWCCMDVQGFSDSPVSWGMMEHSFYADGDNSFTFILRPNGKYVLRTSLSSNRKPRVFQ